MRLLQSALPSLLLALFTTSSAADLLPPATTSFKIHIPPSSQLPNPRSLPPATHATLNTLHAYFSAPLDTTDSFVFHNVSAGSYLLDVFCATHAFAPTRIDVVSSGGVDSSGEEALVVKGWETFRGNDWDNKGEALPGDAMGSGLVIRCLGGKKYFSERSSFNVWGLAKNPILWLGGISMLIYLGLPYIVDNMDPEMREEWEKSQKDSTMNKLLSGGGASSQAAGFDMAAYLSGSTPKTDDAPAPASASGPGKKDKGKRR